MLFLPLLQHFLHAMQTFALPGMRCGKTSQIRIFFMNNVFRKAPFILALGCLILAGCGDQTQKSTARAPIEVADMGNVPVNKVIDIYGFNMNDILDVDPTFLTGAHTHHHGDDVAAFVFTSDKPFDAPRFEQYLQSLVAVYGPDMLRYKGVLYLKGTDRRCVVQGVHMVFGADVLGPWGKDKPETKFVIIGRKLPKEAILKGFESCLA